MTKKGVKIGNFKKSKKVPLDNSEIQLVSKFGLNRKKMRPVGGVTNNIRTNERHMAPLTGNLTHKTILDHPSKLNDSPSGLGVTKLIFRYQALRTDKLNLNNVI